LVELQPPLTDEEKAADTARAVAMAMPAVQIETPETEKPEPADWGEYQRRKEAEREAAVIAQQERILKFAPAVEPAAVPLVDEVTEALAEPEPDPDELPPAWQPEPIEQEPIWVTSTELAQAVNASRASMSDWNGKGLFHGMTRSPARGEGKGERFHLAQCRAAYETRPSRRNRNRPKAPVPLPVVVEDLPPAVEPTPEAAADAAALLDLACGDAATLAALRELLG